MVCDISWIMLLKLGCHDLWWCPLCCNVFLAQAKWKSVTTTKLVSAFWTLISCLSRYKIFRFTLLTILFSISVVEITEECEAIWLPMCQSSLLSLSSLHLWPWHQGRDLKVKEPFSWIHDNLVLQCCSRLTSLSDYCLGFTAYHQMVKWSWQPPRARMITMTQQDMFLLAIAHRLRCINLIIIMGWEVSCTGHASPLKKHLHWFFYINNYPSAVKACVNMC